MRRSSKPPGPEPRGTAAAARPSRRRTPPAQPEPAFQGDADWVQHPLPSPVRALVLIAHADAASRREAGHRFIADVLRANGYAALSFSLHTLAEQSAGRPAPGLVQGKLRVRAMFDVLAQLPGAAGHPAALIGLGDAVQACVAAAARMQLPGLGSIVLLDGHTERASHHLQRLQLPTLFVLGRCGERRLAAQRAATRDVLAVHRTEMLQLPTRPKAASGALEAFTCLALAWLDESLPRLLQPHAGPGGAARCRLGISDGSARPSSRGLLATESARGPGASFGAPCDAAQQRRP